MEPVRSETGFRSDDQRADNQQVYDAILDTFTATARGRWFLAEFARRNRNAEIRMVLDAVARIEQARLRENNEPAGTVPQATPAADQLAAAYRSLRAIREIAWTLRQSGHDTGLCDRLDAHANAIDRNLDQLAPGEAAAGGAAVTASRDEAAIAEAEEAQDLALLDMVAMEMGAPAPDDDDAATETPGATPDRDHDEPASLGAAVIASGALPSSAGRFAAIQSLSQAEKVALFS